MLHDTSDKVLFVNTAAKWFNVKKNESFSMSVTGAGSTEPINIKAKCFSPFDLNSIRTGSDPEHAHEQVYSRSLENLQSLK